MPILQHCHLRCKLSFVVYMWHRWCLLFVNEIFNENFQRSLEFIYESERQFYSDHLSNLCPPSLCLAQFPPYLSIYVPCFNLWNALTISTQPLRAYYRFAILPMFTEVMRCNRSVTRLRKRGSSMITAVDKCLTMSKKWPLINVKLRAIRFARSKTLSVKMCAPI